ncbi:expressed protein [Echinococcus multilocularis]|uniref:Expressed protein n=1 Tax=Echinococcus multilocularis TaxID=6211 RepID=A0A068YC67_ECHMU|nr:expressed protein [Echinococcus multilocularis]
MLHDFNINDSGIYLLKGPPKPYTGLSLGSVEAPLLYYELSRLCLAGWAGFLGHANNPDTFSVLNAYMLPECCVFFRLQGVPRRYKIASVIWDISTPKVYLWLSNICSCSTIEHSELVPMHWNRIVYSYLITPGICTHDPIPVHMNWVLMKLQNDYFVH